MYSLLYSSIEFLWNSLRSDGSKDDQVLLNQALQHCSIKWQSYRTSIKSNSISGECQDTGLKVTVLSLDKVCRHHCTGLHPHVLHPNSKKTHDGKKKTARKFQVWYLRDNWRELSGENVTNFKGFSTKSFLRNTSWLASISIS